MLEVSDPASSAVSSTGAEPRLRGKVTRPNGRLYPRSPQNIWGVLLPPESAGELERLYKLFGRLTSPRGLGAEFEPASDR